MKAYTGQTRGKFAVNLLREKGIGECTCRGEFPPRRTPWFYDNGAFKDWNAGKPFDEVKFKSDIDKIKVYDGVKPDFIVVPDILGGGLESLQRSLEWADKLNGIAPLALAVQDGISPSDLINVNQFQVIFVGGSVKWKINTGGEWVKYAHSNGLICHIGRVGPSKRVEWAFEIEADSIDSCWPLWTKERLRLWCDLVTRKTSSQGKLW